jgi:hypothetical protein
MRCTQAPFGNPAGSDPPVGTRISSRFLERGIVADEQDALRRSGDGREELSSKVRASAAYAFLS